MNSVELAQDCKTIQTVEEESPLLRLFDEVASSA